MNITEKIFKIFKKAAVVLWWSFTVLLMFTIIAIMGAKMKGKIPYFFGYSVMNIVSGSMEDTIPQGSYILIKKTDPSEIRKGDIICFFSDDPAIKGFPNTHTVVEDPIVGENGIEFVTKGEANLTKDEETAKGNKLIGKYVTNLEWLTRLSRFLEGSTILLISTSLLVLCAVLMIASVFLKSKKDSDEESAEEADEIQADQTDIDAPQL
jgi:signal peptidase